MSPKVLTIGTFDLLHRGHLRLFERCNRLGSVYVGLNSDRFVEKYKGEAPVIPYEMRYEFVKALKHVHSVYENDGPGYYLIRLIRPQILVVGTDWAKKDYYKQIGMTADELEMRGILLVYIPYTEGVSSTLLRAAHAQI